MPAGFPALMSARRSIRRYLSRPVSHDVIDSLIEAAIAAPSAHNRQPWRFLVLDDAEVKHDLATAMGERLRADRLKDNDPIDAVEADRARSYERLTSAPVLIVICLSMVDMDRYPDDRRNAAERTMAVQGVAMAAENLLLASHAAGLGACWVCAPLFCPDVVSGVLSLPEDWEPQGIVTLGYPADAGKPYRRRSRSDVTRYGVSKS